METYKKNGITYKTTQVNKLEPTDLVKFQIDQLAVSPFLYVTRDKDGKNSLMIDVPQKEIADLFEQATEELENDNYEEVKNLYEKAYRIDSLYFKSASNLGDAWSFLGDYHRAEYYLKRAIQLNDAGYQEYLFLADVYDKTGKNREALDAITYAFMLNKNNPYLLYFLQNILEKNNLCLNEDRLQFPFRIKKTGVTECEIQYLTPDGFIWHAMANCLACWEMETDLQIKLQGENMFSYKVQMYRECLLNQGYYLDILKKGGKKLSEKEETFLEKIRKKHVDSIVFWEIMAGEEPYIMFLLSAKERQMIVEYIKKYVYQSRTN
jgi:tetratricopeptide (TPR) repeat protein